MADFLGLMKQAAELKSKMETMQAELDQIEVEGTSGGGLVTVLRHTEQHFLVVGENFGDRRLIGPPA